MTDFADTLDDILGDIDDNEFDRAIATIIRVAADINDAAAADIMEAARVADPTFSGPGALIRDALRNNTELTIEGPAPKPKTTRRAPAKKAPAKKAPAKPEFAPKVTDSGRLDHSDCGHERTMAGRTKCRAVAKAAAAQKSAKK